MFNANNLRKMFGQHKWSLATASRLRLYGYLFFFVLAFSFFNTFSLPYSLALLINLFLLAFGLFVLSRALCLELFILPVNCLDLYVVVACNPLGISHIVTTLTFFSSYLTAMIFVIFFLCRTAYCAKPEAENFEEALDAETNKILVYELIAQNIDPVPMAMALDRHNQAVVLFRGATAKQNAGDPTFFLTDVESKSLIMGSNDYFPAGISRFTYYERHCLVLHAQMARDKVACTLSLPAQALSSKFPKLSDEQLQGLVELDITQPEPVFMNPLPLQLKLQILRGLQEQREEALAVLQPIDLKLFVSKPETVSLYKLDKLSTLLYHPDYARISKSILDFVSVLSGDGDSSSDHSVWSVVSDSENAVSPVSAARATVSSGVVSPIGLPSSSDDIGICQTAVGHDVVLTRASFRQAKVDSPSNLSDDSLISFVTGSETDLGCANRSTGLASLPSPVGVVFNEDSDACLACGIITQKTAEGYNVVLPGITVRFR